MLTRMLQRLNAEDGVSLVEMLVGILIISIGLLTMLHSAVTAIAGTQRNERMVRGTAVANDLLENAQAIPWRDLGHFSSELGATPPADAVIIGGSRPSAASCAAATPPAGCRAPRRTETLTRDGITYEVTRNIAWFDNPQTSESEDYKRVLVEVRWQVPGGQVRFETVEGLRAPTPTEQTASAFVLTRFDGAPSIVYLDDDGRIRDPSPGPALYDTTPLELTATTNAPSSNYVEVSYTDRSGASKQVHLSSINMVDSRLTIGGASIFRNGDTTFVFKAVKGSETVSGTKLVRFLHDLQVSTVTANPPSWCLPAHMSAVAPSVTFTIDVKGAVQEDEVLVTRDGVVTQATPTTSDVNGTKFVYIVPAGAYAESFQLSVAVRRLADDAQVGPVAHTFNVERPVSC